MRFEKWEGLGNDFVLVAASEEDVAPSSVREICDRHRGIGADGVVWVEMLGDRLARMVIYNADGSRPEMCGNGLRCVAGYAAQRAGFDQADVMVRTDAGERPCRVTRATSMPLATKASAGALFEVSAPIGTAAIGTEGIVAAGHDAELVRVDIGNPHAVRFGAADDALLAELGPGLQKAIAGGINVELCQPHLAEQRLDVLVWERGVGPTLACGTGAGAATAAAVEAGHVRVEVPVRVALPGGELEVTVFATKRPQVYRVDMQGPARCVFKGEL